MASKQVVARQKSSEDIIAGIKTHQETLISGMESLLRPHLEEGEELPDVALLIQLMGRALSATTREMVDADQSVAREVGEEGETRSDTEAQVERARQHVFKVRHLINVYFDEQTVNRVGLEGTTPDDPVALSRQLQTVLEGLGTLNAPTQEVPGPEFDRAAWIAALTREHASLKAATTAHATELRETEAARVKRDQLANQHERVFSTVAGFASRLLLLAGEDQLAARLRPSSRRPGRTIERAENPPEDDTPQTPS